jgi:activating signal cointegrator 1
VKALSLWQPWASLVALGVKTLETRSWSTSHRGPLAIHAAAAVPDHAFGQCQRHRRWTVGDFTIERDNPRGTARAYLMRGPIAWPYRLPLGAIVATCTLVDVVPVVGADGCTNATKHLCIVNQSMLLHSPLNEPWPDGETEHIVSDQLPYGDFTPDRFAWLLADIKPFAEPIPARGRQGLWNWQEAA